MICRPSCRPARPRQHKATLGWLGMAAAGLALGLASPARAATTLTLYSAQHEQTVDMLTKAFT